MEDKKILNNEDLEKVSGGSDCHGQYLAFCRCDNLNCNNIFPFAYYSEENLKYAELGAKTKLCPVCGSTCEYDHHEYRRL